MTELTSIALKEDKTLEPEMQFCGLLSHFNAPKQDFFNVWNNRA